MPINKIQVKTIGISQSETSNAFYGLILAEVSGERHLPIVIGQQEAQAIMIPLEHINIPRPIIYDTFINTLSEINCSFKEVFIYKKVKGVYFSKIILQTERVVEVEARPSDAIALALRCEAPIYVNEEIMNTSGINANGGKREKAQPIEVPLSEMNKAQLETLLAESLKTENYERAAIIRDLLKTKL